MLWKVLMAGGVSALPATTCRSLLVVCLFFSHLPDSESCDPSLWYSSWMKGKESAFLLNKLHTCRSRIST